MLRLSRLSLARRPTFSAALPRLAAIPRHHLCTAATEEKAEAPAAEPESSEPKLLYEGGKNKAVMMLKKVSIANLGFALASTPLLQYITSASGQGGKGAVMSALLVGMGAGTTGGLAWATGTYALNIYSVPGKNAMMIETPTLLGGVETTEVSWDAVERPQGYHPFATFQAAGDKFYIDELGELHDETFTTKLEEAINS